jgi:hypothetical protein
MVQNCPLIGYYAASSGISLPTVRDNLSVPSSRVKQDQGRVKNSSPSNMRPIGCPETSARNYHYLLCNNPEGRSSHLLRGGSLKLRGMVQLTNRDINADLLKLDSWILDHD